MLCDSASSTHESELACNSDAYRAAVQLSAASRLSGAFVSISSANSC